jgi:CRISPR/Cas system-associated exonuclease Cas4 (RecB family)
LVYIETAIATLTSLAKTIHQWPVFTQYSHAVTFFGGMVLLLMLLVFLSALVRIWRLLTKGDIIYADNGRRSRIFKNPVYRVQAKPDLLRRVSTGIQLVEYKGREKGFYDSDWAEALTAALSVRGEGIKVTQVMLRNKTQSKIKHLPESDRELFALVESDINVTRMAASNQPIAFATQFQKCQGCGFYQKCTKRYRAAS